MDKILEVKKLKIAFRTSNGTLKAVRDISFDLERGKTLAIVGESGSGKSVTSKAIIGILAGNSIVEGGEILYDGRDLLRIPEEEMHHIRGDKISMIFQDPLSSLNPIVKIGKQITEAMLLKNKANRADAKKQFDSMLKLICVHMEAAGVQQVKEKTDIFRKLSTKASEIENEYNQSMTVMTDLYSDAEDVLFRVSKNQRADVGRFCRDSLQKLNKIKNKYALMSAAGIEKVKEGLNSGSEQALKDLRDMLAAMSESVKPDFMAIAYAENTGAMDVTGSDITALNETLRKKLNSEFMDEYIAMIARGAEHSYTEALGYKREVIADLAAAHDYYSGSFTRQDGMKYAEKLNEKVSRSIDRLEIIKDSAAYAFGVSLKNAVTSYFVTQAYSAREEKRFAVQSAKRDKLIARGKTVEWKVIPKNVYSVDELRGNILTVVDRVAERYNEYIERPVDFEQRAKELVAFLESKKSDMVYRISRGMAKEKAIRLMEEVGIHEPRTRYYQYPFEFSGGMRQRIVIAIALVADPDILICDEPTTALDVTIQAQILELINRLKEQRHLSVIFITHDLGVVANMADDIAVMYAGQIIEYGTADDIFYDPRHPYTWALLSSMPDLDTTEKLEAIPGTPPNMIYPPVGDAFAERNKYAMEIDFEQQPPMFRVSDTHYAATWLLHPGAPKVEIPKIIQERARKAGGVQNV